MDNYATWYPHCVQFLPHMFQILDFTPDTIVFMGRFSLEECMLPVEGILITTNSWFHVTITAKEILEDSDEEEKDPNEGAFYDEEVGGYIRLFPPDECIQIKYTTLKELKTKEEVAECEERVETLGKQVWKRSEEIRQAREERELDEYIAERNRLYAEQKEKEAAEKATTEAIIPDVILETIGIQESHSDSKESRYCGCENDPYPEDAQCDRDISESNCEEKSNQENVSGEDDVKEVALEENHQEENEYYHSDGDESWHCGCEYDPYPDDPYCGRPPPDFEFELDLRKASGEARHAKKAVYKGNKYHKKPTIIKKECEEHAHHKQRILRNTIASQTKGGDMSP